MIHMTRPLDFQTTRFSMGFPNFVKFGKLAKKYFPGTKILVILLPRKQIYQNFVSKISKISKISEIRKISKILKNLFIFVKSKNRVEGLYKFQKIGCSN